MNHKSKLAALKLMLALLLAASAQAQIQRPPGQQFLPPDADGPTAQGQPNWQDVGEVYVDLKRTCKEPRIVKEDFVLLDNSKEYVQVSCVLKQEDRREPKNRPEVSGWRCELIKEPSRQGNKVEKKVKATYFLTKHPNCVAGDNSDEPISYLKVTLTVKVVEAKNNQSSSGSNQP